MCSYYSLSNHIYIHLVVTDCPSDCCPGFIHKTEKQKGSGHFIFMSLVNKMTVLGSQAGFLSIMLKLGILFLYRRELSCHP